MTTTFFEGRTGIGVHQRRKFFELRNQYTLTGEDGQPAGTVEQSKQSALAWVARLATSLDTMLPTTLVAADASGTPVLVLEKPWLTWRVAVREPAGRVVGSITRKLRVGKPVYLLHGPSGEEIGLVRAEDWRSRNFQVVDVAGTETGRVTMQWRGLLSEIATDADSYAVTFSEDATADQRAMAFAGALAVDLVQKQKDAGGGITGALGG